MTEVLDAYLATRERMAALALTASPVAQAAMVPSCPEWTVKDLMGHVVALPAAIASGDLPGDDLGAWLDDLILGRRQQPMEDLVGEWMALDDAIAAVLDRSEVLYGDLGVHEHDLRGALGEPDHDALETEVFLPRTVAAFAGPLRAAGLDAIVVRHPSGECRSHDAPAGWILEVSPWEATRALNSRRTAAELRALPGSGDPEPFIPVLDAHLPLPAHSLAEP